MWALHLYFQAHTFSPLHWFLHWRKLKTQEWWVLFLQGPTLRGGRTIYKWKDLMLYLPQVTVSSGGMLTQKLNVDDLQFEKGTFDGTMAYAQNKVRDTGLQLMCTDQRAAVTRIHVWVMHLCFSLCGRDSKWFWPRDGVLSTNRSTSPPCTLAGPIHQVWKEDISADAWSTSAGLFSCGGSVTTLSSFWLTELLTVFVKESPAILSRKLLSAICLPSNTFHYDLIS